MAEDYTTEESPKCSDDPRAPHGFLRNASHNAGRYVCECEYWVPMDSQFANSEDDDEA